MAVQEKRKKGNWRRKLGGGTREGGRRSIEEREEGSGITPPGGQARLEVERWRARPRTWAGRVAHTADLFLVREGKKEGNPQPYDARLLRPPDAVPGRLVPAVGAAAGGGR